MSASTRYHEIDLFRFTAAMLVVLFHYTFRGYAADGYSPLSFPWLGSVFKYGYLGVDLFFIISGFVILMSASQSTAIRFTISRVVRLYPAFWAGVTLTALFIVFLGDGRFQVDLRQYLLNLSMVSGYLDVRPVDSVYWTLLIELKFYALIFLLLLLRQIRRIEPFLIAWLAFSLSALFIKYPVVPSFFLFPDWSSYFIAGCTFYLVRQHGLSPARVALLLGTCGLSIRHALEVSHGLEAHYQTPFSPVVIAALIAGFYLLFLLLALGKTGWFNRKSMVSLGVLTYPLYLVHQYIGFILINRFAGHLDKHLVLLGTIVVVLALSYAIHRCIEVPFAPRLKRLLSSMQMRLPRALRET